ncbi:AMP-binding protein [Alphaproteobacteria bacterium HT1-32]|nr:AMP-binding protein [Alphaproteobacteria bacterium HT1-32]
MTAYTAHLDTFARDNLPPPDQWPVMDLAKAGLKYPERLNCATELLDNKVQAGLGPKPVFYTPRETWTYANLQDRANRIAHVLVDELGLKPGNRVLIRAANNPMFVACWFAIAKAGGIVVATMPLLRAKELSVIIDKAEIDFALCDERLSEEMEKTPALTSRLQRICYFNGSGEPGAGAELERLMSDKSPNFDTVQTAAEDVVLIAFTSGTTGLPKGTMHFHRDVMIINDAYCTKMLRPGVTDIFIGSPPIAFTFGLGGLVTFPMHVGAATVLLEKASPPVLAAAIDDFRATICFTAPTAYRVMTDLSQDFALTSLRKCISAGETLPVPIHEDWKRATGIGIMDGMGATEMLHIFISFPEEMVRPGVTGMPVPGYEAMIVDDNMNEMPRGEVGKLAVRGPTGCRYLADDRQKNYVRDGWNLTGDAFLQDEDGFFRFAARADDMIISSGYNISGPEVEEALLSHDAVAECGVVAAPDAARGHIVKAYVVLREGQFPSPELVKHMQDYVKNAIAPYKYPRAIEFLPALPRTETGKVQRFRLRQMAEGKE